MIFYRTTSILLRNCKFLKYNITKNWNFNILNTLQVFQRHYTLNEQYGPGDPFKNHFDETFNNVEVVVDNGNDLTINKQSLEEMDVISETINNSTSIEEVLNTVASNRESIKLSHLTEAVHILCIYQKLFCKMNGYHYPLRVQTFNMLPDHIRNFIIDLQRSDNFELLLNMIETSYKDMDIKSLTNNLLNLVKLGLSVKDNLPQLLIKEFQSRFNNGDYTLNSIATFTTVIFMETDLYSYYMVKDVIPTIYSSIARCHTSMDLKNITNCLINLHWIVSEDVIQQYNEKVNELLNNNILNSKEYRTIAKVLLLLNNQQFRRKNVTLMRKCMMSLESSIHHIPVTELLIIYEVYHKIHEPALILNEVQRCANSHLQNLVEDGNLFYDIHIKLITCLACFSSSKRIKLNSFLYKYIDLDLNYKALQEYYKLLLISKSNNLDVCKQYWDRVLNCMDKMHKHNYYHVIESYVNFYRKLYSFRYEKFEEKLDKIVDMEIQNGVNVLVPWKCAILASYVIAFSNNEAHLEYFLYKVKENVIQFDNIDCFNVTKGIEIGLKTKYHQYVSLMSVLKDIERYVSESNIKLEHANLLLVCYGCSSSYDKVLDNKIIEMSKNSDYQTLSSQTIMNIVNTLEKTDLFLPGIIEEIYKYFVDHNYSIMGFVAEKVITMYYYLGYVPDNPKFIEIVTNLLIRDERRLSSLSYIESALALCFFQSLPDAMVKQIFNVEFLENIDNELMNCYHKDTYPFRVRQRLMQLNRAVCLDYPEKNVPWFHQNFIEYMKKYDKPSRTKLHAHFKQILENLIKDSELGSGNVLDENVYTPYGYFIDFALHKNDNRTAILLLEPSAYTKYNVQLKGEHSLKIRHLEMLGYKVIIIKNDIVQQMDINEQIKYFRDIIK